MLQKQDASLNHSDTSMTNGIDKENGTFSELIIEVRWMTLTQFNGWRMENPLCPPPSSSRENPSLYYSKMGALLEWLWNVNQHCLELLVLTFRILFILILLFILALLNDNLNSHYSSFIASNWKLLPCQQDELKKIGDI